MTIILASGSLWNYYRDEINDSGNESNDADNYRINNNKTTASKCFEYKTKIMGRRPNDNILDAEIVVPLKYLSNFWRSFDFSLINCEIELDLSWSRYCVGSQLWRTNAVVGNLPVAATATTSARFRISNAKFYVPVVTLSINDNI